jgi:hypothetical protein
MMAEFPALLLDPFADAKKTFELFPLEDGKYFTPSSLYKFYHKTSKRMTMEDATTSFSNFVAGSPLGNKVQLDFHGFSTCVTFHLDKLNNAADAGKVKTDLCKSTLQMIGSDTAQFTKLFGLPSDLSKSEVQEMMKEMEEHLRSKD